jgi:hypothetical protein
MQKSGFCIKSIVTHDNLDSIKFPLSKNVNFLFSICATSVDPSGWLYDSRFANSIHVADIDNINVQQAEGKYFFRSSPLQIWLQARMQGVLFT